MSITVGLIGATGRTGGWVLEACLEKGYKVVALARSKDKLKDYQDKITIAEGDDTAVEGIQSLLSSASLDVIISTIGSPSKEIIVVKKTATALVGALTDSKSTNMPRIVWMTSTGINEATDQAKMYTMFGKPSKWFFGYGGFGWLQFKILIPYVIGQNLWDDMGFSEDVIRESETVLAKTVIVRPCNMHPVSEHQTFSDGWKAEGGDNLEYVFTKAEDPPVGKWMVRRAIAKALVDLATDDSYDGKAMSLFQKQ